jgi:multidrug efflux pump subunit AcrA (membrane-fusion protein)
MKKGIRIGLVIVIVLVLVAGLGGFIFTRFKDRLPAGRGGPAAEVEEYTVPVAVARVRTGPLSETISLYGTVFAEKEVNIFTTITGKVDRIRVEEGDTVRRDQVLAEIDRAQTGLTYAPAQVESTIDGVVKAVLTEEGASAAPGSPLFQIADMDRVEVGINIPEKELARVKAGFPAAVEVIAYPGRIFRGEVIKLSPVVDAVSRSRAARVRVDNPGFLLKPGMFAEVRILLREEAQALLIPLAALVDKGGERAVYVVENDRVRLVRPQISFTADDLAMVSGGLSAGDRVVVIGQQNIEDGDRVNVAEER